MGSPHEILGEGEAPHAVKALSHMQFKSAVNSSPVYSKAQGSQGYFFHGGHLSAFGTEHPVDVALGNARRVAGFKADAAGGHPGGAALLHAASVTMGAAPSLPSLHTRAPAQSLTSSTIPSLSTIGEAVGE